MTSLAIVNVWMESIYSTVWRGTDIWHQWLEAVTAGRGRKKRENLHLKLMLNTWDQDRKHMKYRSEMSWRKVPFPLHGSPLLILLFSPLFFVSMESPHKIRQGYAFCSIFCAYMKLAFFFSLLPFDPSVSSAFHLPPRLWRTDTTAWIKSFFLHISAGLLWHFFFLCCNISCLQIQTRIQYVEPHFKTPNKTYS